MADGRISETWQERIRGTYPRTAVNFAPESENAIHQDRFAKRFGYTGGLVPGVGIYALMTDPLVEVLGREWLENGWMHAKFIRPVFHGETIDIVCEETEGGSTESEAIVLKVLNPSGTLCAVGTSGLRSKGGAPPHAGDYMFQELPDPDARLTLDPVSLKPGSQLGSVPVRRTPENVEEAYYDELRKNQQVYDQGSGCYHAGFLPHVANKVVFCNIAVGPWIHTESRVTHFQLPDRAKNLMMKGHIQNCFEKRGHLFVTLDLAVFDAEDLAVSHIEHTAIVRPHLEEST